MAGWTGSVCEDESAISVETKPQGKLGYPEYACIPDDGCRHEVMDGEHVVNPAPDLYHQQLSRRIPFQLYTQIELSGRGEVIDAPADLQLSAWDIVQPALVVVLSHNRSILRAQKIEGAPDLVVEILATTTVHGDRVVKKELYRKSGIPEYWVVDPEACVVEQFLLREGVYELLGRHTDEIALQVLDGVRVSLRGVW